jgi:ketosteroid isomerase-like protein
MPRSLLVVVIASSLVAAACTQDVREEALVVPAGESALVSTSGEDAVAAITKMEHEWVDAIVKKDTAALDRLLADDFNGTSPTAHLYTKKMAIEDLANGTYVVEAMALDEISVNVYGDTAVAFTSQEEKSRYENADFSGHYHYTDVWAKKDGRWQAVASHGSRYATGH